MFIGLERTINGISLMTLHPLLAVTMPTVKNIQNGIKTRTITSKAIASFITAVFLRPDTGPIPNPAYLTATGMKLLMNGGALTNIRQKTPLYTMDILIPQNTGAKTISPAFHPFGNLSNNWTIASSFFIAVYGLWQ